MANLAIEFETDQLLVAQARTAGRRIEFTHTFSVPIESSHWCSATAASVTKPIAESLKQRLTATGGVKQEAVVIVSRSLAEIRELTVPPAPEDELPDMVRFLAKEGFASFNDQWKLDFVALPQVDGEPSRRVLAAAIGPQLMENIESICQHSNLKIKRVLLRPCASVSLLKSKVDDKQIRLFVDQNNGTIDLSLIQGPQILSTRTIRLSTDLAAEQRSKKMINEVRRTLASAKPVLAGRKIEQVIITGEAARNRHLAGDITGPLGMQVEFFNPFEQVKFHKRSNNDLVGSENAAKYTALLGALVATAENRKPVLDFLNPRRPVVKKQDFSRYYLYGGLAAAAMLMAVAYGWWLLRSQAEEIAAEKSNLDAAIKLNAGNGKSPSIDSRLAETDLIDQWKLTEVNWLVEFSELSNRYLLPDDVIADSLTAETRSDGNRRITLSGRIVEDLQKTENLLQKLTDRPYSVEPLDIGTVPADRKSEYPSSFKYQIKLMQSGVTLNELNLRSRDFIAAASSAETPSTETPPTETLSSELNEPATTDPDGAN